MLFRLIYLLFMLFGIYLHLCRRFRRCKVHCQCHQEHDCNSNRKNSGSTFHFFSSSLLSFSATYKFLYIYPHNTKHPINTFSLKQLVCLFHDQPQKQHPALRLHIETSFPNSTSAYNSGTARMMEKANI